jgi:hypothetical protein
MAPHILQVLFLNMRRDFSTTGEMQLNLAVFSLSLSLSLCVCVCVCVCVSVFLFLSYIQNA